MAEGREIVKNNKLALPAEVLVNNRYIIKNVLGIGGFGITYNAYDVYNKNICAVKELFINDAVVRGEDGKTVVPHNNRTALFKHGIKRFMEEAEILHKLNGAPNVVRITDYFRENNTAYFVMDYVEGVTLGQFVARHGGTIDIQTASDIIYKIGRTLEFINTRYGIYHRDLSPENILIKDDREPILIDFGNAKSYVRDSGKSLSVVLKPGFAPPEQYTGKNQGPWTDVYSLAGIFYFIVSGKKIPQAPDRLAGVEYEPLHTVSSECSKSLSDSIDRALDINFKNRIKSPGELVKAMYVPNNSTHCYYPYLTIIENGGIKEKWRLPVGEDVVVGRDASVSNIVLKGNDRISKRHMLISYLERERVFKVIDVSTNGVFVNKKRLKKNVDSAVLPGSMLILGNEKTIIKVELQ